jgi:hypothetical protein
MPFPIVRARTVGATAVLAALVYAVVALSLPSLAAAATPFDVFHVNSKGNGNKTAAGNVCEVAPGECTLRAALEAADANVGLSEIDFQTGPFDGTETTAIDLEGTALPALETPIEVHGMGCEPVTGPTPCVRLVNPSPSQPFFSFTSTESEVSEITMVGGGTAVRLGGSKNRLHKNVFIGTTTSTATAIEVTGNENLVESNRINEEAPSCPASRRPERD